MKAQINVFFAVFIALFVIFLNIVEFPSVKTSKIFIAHRTQRNTNFKQEKSRVCKGSFFDFFKFTSFTAANKLVL